MKFLWCTITTDNMEKSLKFYQEIVGLPVGKRFESGPGVEIVFLGEGETRVELISNPAHKASEKIEGIAIGFEVEAVDEMIQFVKEKGLEAEGPYQPNPHVKFFYVRDPNGVKVQFVENM